MDAFVQSEKLLSAPLYNKSLFELILIGFPLLNYGFLFILLVQVVSQTFFYNNVFCSLFLCGTVLVLAKVCCVATIYELPDSPDLSFVQYTQILQMTNSSATNNTFLRIRAPIPLFLFALFPQVLRA